MQDKIKELKEEFKSSTPPNIIAITELKPKNYSRQLTKNRLKVDGYRFGEANLRDKGSTRGVAILFVIHSSVIKLSPKK